MAKRETFAALLKTRMRRGEGWEAFAARAGLTSRAVRILRERGGQRPYRGTVAKLATALGVSEERVEAAIRVSADG